MDRSAFAVTRRDSTLDERSAARVRIIDPCRLVGAPTQAGADRDGTTSAHEKGTAETAGGNGVAEVWRRTSFHSEDKSPPLTSTPPAACSTPTARRTRPRQVVADMDRWEVRSHITGTRPARSGSPWLANAHAALDRAGFAPSGEASPDPGRCRRTRSAPPADGEPGAVPEVADVATVGRQLTGEPASAAHASPLRPGGSDGACLTDNAILHGHAG